MSLCLCVCVCVCVNACVAAAEPSGGLRGGRRLTSPRFSPVRSDAPRIPDSRTRPASWPPQLVHASQMNTSCTRSSASKRHIYLLFLFIYLFISHVSLTLCPNRTGVAGGGRRGEDDGAASITAAVLRPPPLKSCSCI